MAMISIQDKEIVKHRIAQGASTRTAIHGTSIKSNHTAAQIAKKESHSIAQIRAEYLHQIRGLGAHDVARAKQWAEMTIATKQLPNGKEIPDWKARYDALKYIDSLTGIHEDINDQSDQLPILVLDRGSITSGS